MKNTAPRIDVGVSDTGAVFIHSFGGTPVAGRLTKFRYEVRVGSMTLVTKDTLPAAEAVAYALVGIPAPVHEPEPVAKAPASKAKKAK